TAPCRRSASASGGLPDHAAAGRVPSAMAPGHGPACSRPLRRRHSFGRAQPPPRTTTPSAVSACVVTGGSRRKADLAIIGAGASGTHALLALLKELGSGDRKRTRPLRIVIVDRDPQ